ncbi:MAG: 4Fe-4S dicluster domain-containing protein [Desulfovibrio sp.]|jgi:ferredoxin|nr:4Fe-4S dicluster domain-containing protein [Desulfovibrio sp.]
MLRKIRIFVAACCFIGLCLLFVDVSGLATPILSPLAKLQFVPAAISGGAAIALAILAATFLLGRVYCSTLCPLGVLQDIIGRIGGRRHAFTPNLKWLRLGSLVVFVACFAAGGPLIVDLLEPYSAFGRIATDLFAPVWQAGSNVLAAAAARADSFAIGPTPIWQKGIGALVAAILTLTTVGVLAWRGGRTWCNTLCPVGAVLGLLGRHAILRHRVDWNKCNGCGTCDRRCKANCIDTERGVVDGSRCVACFDCIDVCPRKAITYGFAGSSAAPASSAPPASSESSLSRDAAIAPEAPSAPQTAPPDPGRRNLLAMLSLGALAPHMLRRDMQAEEQIPALTRRLPAVREVPVVPPGAQSLEGFRRQCTGCQLCVASCPAQALSAAQGGKSLLQPTLTFEHGYCRVNCVTCSTLCPTGAIKPIDAAVKSATQIGRAVVDRSVCINETSEDHCNACVRNCPPGAITLVQGEGDAKRIAIDTERCTGCGACEYICPVRPMAAIWVEGNLEHRRI